MKKMIAFLTRMLFPQRAVSINNSGAIDLRKWQYLCEIDDGYKRTVIHSFYSSPQKLKVLCGALVYVDEKTRKKWLDSAVKIEGLDFKQKLEMCIKDLNISKLQSDKQKAHIANNLAKWDEWRKPQISFNSWLSSQRLSDFHN